MLKTKQNKRTQQVKKRRTVGLISAVQSEGALLIKGLGLVRRAGPGPACFTSRAGGTDYVYVVSGMAKANAGHAAGLLIRDYSPDVVVSFGIGGAYPGAGLTVGDVAVATKEVYADEGVETTKGFHPLEMIGIPMLRARGKRYFNEFPLNRRLGKRALSAALTVGRAASGPFATVSTCTGTRKKAVQLRTRLRAICENMEGAAIAQICSLYGIPCAELRGISNIVEDRDRSRWDILLAARVACEAVLALLAGADLRV